jgi:molybdate-binding protein
MIAGFHILDPASGEYNVPALRALSGLHDLVAIEWGWREQGLLVAPGNPLGISSLDDLAGGRVSVGCRQEDAGAQMLFRHLLQARGIPFDDLTVPGSPALSETDLAVEVLDGRADCGLAVRAVARRFRLDFIPLHRERFDLAMSRREYFEPPIQSLLGFARSAAFVQRASELEGYAIGNLGRVVFNG